jgi:dipeptidyl aminopeptidase/acylaminoacyl peptidase
MARVTSAAGVDDWRDTFCRLASPRALVCTNYQKNNLNVYWLVEWNTEELHSTPAPTLLLKMCSSSNRPAIESVRWLGDNRTIVFLGERPGELHQVFTYNLRTQQLRKLTHHPTNILTYSIRGDGEALAYVAEDKPRAVFDSSAWTRRSD